MHPNILSCLKDSIPCMPLFKSYIESLLAKKKENKNEEAKQNSSGQIGLRPLGAHSQPVLVKNLKQFLPSDLNRFEIENTILPQNVLEKRARFIKSSV